MYYHPFLYFIIHTMIYKYEIHFSVCSLIPHIFLTQAQKRFANFSFCVYNATGNESYHSTLIWQGCY